MRIFDIFSKRGKKLPEEFQTTNLPKPFRVQVSRMLDKLFPDILGKTYRSHSIRSICPDYIAEALKDEYGVFCLVDHSFAYSEFPRHDELRAFVLEEAKTERVIDVIEFSFRVAEDQYEKLAPYSRAVDVPELIKAVNHRFREHGIGYCYDGGMVIPSPDPIVREEVLSPMLTALSDPSYRGADEEFRSAVKSYRRGDNDQCILDCGKAFESTMKIICDKQKWSYDPRRDNAKKLIGAIFKNKLIPDRMQTKMHGLRQLLESAIPPIRNQAGVGHGQGAIPLNAPDHMARFILFTTAVTIQMLVESEKQL